MFMTRAAMALLFILLCATSVAAQIAVTVSQVKTTGNKAIVPLTMKNGFAEKIESARAVCFLLDDQGKMVGQASRWIIGGTRDKAGLAAGATNAFNFVVAAARPLTSTNLTAKVSFSRVVLEGGKLADVNKEVQIQNADK
jgi:hypothetical protein